ncbi:MAG: transglutaminase-like domain-containing protein [Gemmataceae bacterium]|nr:transglutaminase-like domain-containing protein [Gemmataceae bacterium]
MLRLVLASGLWLGVAAALVPSVAQEPAPLAPRDFEPQLDWYGVYIKGKKIGYARMSREKVEEGVRESFLLVMKLVSFGQKAEVSLSQSLVFESKPPYRLLRVDYQQNAGDIEATIKLTRRGDGFQIVHQAGGETKTKEHGPIDYSYRDATTIERWIRSGPKVGAKIVSKDFHVQELRLDPQENTIKAVKKSLVAGVPVTYYEVETVSPQLTLLSRIDNQGRMLSGKFALFDIQMESEKDAKNTEFSQDLFVLGMVKIDQPLGRTSAVRELVLEVVGVDEAIFPDGPRQSMVRRDGKQPPLLKLGKRYGKESKATAVEVEENLKETLAYPITHPKVQALAREAIGDAQTAAEKVKRVVAFVHDYISPNLTASLPNIHDLIQRKKGDCKSYALLTATLLRAAGVPAREVSGLLYIGDDGKSFGGHAWNEAIIDGVWVPIDASMNETEINATHISFGPQDRAAKGLLESMGRLSFRLVEVTTAP